VSVDAQESPGPLLIPQGHDGGVSELTESDLEHLRRCVALARAAYDAGEEPFGSVLVSPLGQTLFEDHNRTSGDDQTRHPELEIARWAGQHLPRAERGRCTVYTSGEHCPMCSAAHAWAGLGRIVYAVSSAQLTRWRDGWGLAPGPVAPLPVHAVAPGVPVAGPAPELEEEMHELHRRTAQRQWG
jgi:tRNA(Arg) A34 adenosine deaminase TadA